MATNSVWLIDPEDMTREWMGQVEKELRQRLLDLMERYKGLIEQYMKSNAAWTDRTANLRQSLYADIIQSPDTLTLLFDYGLDYGRYLEFRADLAARFAIVNPTFDWVVPRFFTDLDAILMDL